MKMEGKNMKKAFDWEQCSKQHRPAHAAWLKANHDKPVTAAEYAEAYKELRASDNRPNNARRYSTAKTMPSSFSRTRSQFNNRRDRGNPDACNSISIA
jgi:hypothetical protein